MLIKTPFPAANVVKMLGFVCLLACTIAVQVLAATSQEPCLACETCDAVPDPYAACKCDHECGVFRDCCNSQLPLSCRTSSAILLEPPPAMECLSTFLDPMIDTFTNETFMMVSSCPSLANRVDIDAVDLEAIMVNCTSPIVDLPPVTDKDSGLVYRNEYCARCNGASNLVAWQPDLACSREFYVQLLTSGSISDILLERPDILNTDCLPCAYQPPSLPNVLRSPRPCTPLISSCLSQLELEAYFGRSLNQTYNDLVESCLASPLNPVGVEQSLRFRSSACRQCNAFDDKDVTCSVSTASRFRNPFECALPFNETDSGGSVITGLPAVPFTLTLSNLGGGQVRITTPNSGTATVPVDCPEGQAPIGLQCRDTQCPEGYSEIGGRCAFAVGAGGILIDGEGMESPSAIVHPNASTPSFLDCPSALLPLNNSEFMSRGNNTIFHDGELIQVLFYDSNGRPLICPDNTSLTVTNSTITVIALLPGIVELTYAGCSLSVLGSVLILLTYGLFSELRTFPSLLLMNLAVAILITNLLFVMGGPIIQHFPSANLCIVVAICLHFFNLVQFTWMSLFSIEMAYTFYLAKKLVRKTDRNVCRTLLLYMLIGWGLPVVICVITTALNFSGQGLVLYGVTADGSVGNCWINHFPSFILSFLVPLVVSLLVNIALLVVVTIFMCQSCNNQARQKHQTPHTALVRVWVAIFIIAGPTWVLGFLAIPDQTNWAWYPFVLLNSTQGFVIFLTFLCTRKILGLYVNLLKGNGRQSATANKKPSKKKALASTKGTGVVTASAPVHIEMNALAV